MKPHIEFIGSAAATSEFCGKTIVPRSVVGSASERWPCETIVAALPQVACDSVVIAFVSLVRGVGNMIYGHAFPIYRLCYRGFKAYTDRAEQRLLKTIVSAGDVVVDAGANIGIYSKFLSSCVGPEGVVHSFEPSPEHFKRLQSAMRKLANVRLCQVAVGEWSGRGNLYLSDKLNVDHRTYTSEGDSRRAVPIDI